MIVSVQALPADGRAFSLHWEPAELDRDLAGAGFRDVAAAGPLDAEIRVLRSGRDVFAVGRIRTRIRYACGRCLAPFEREVDADVHAAFSPREASAAGEVELREEDLELEALSGGELDLSKVVLDQLYLLLEPYPVCGEECRGLCPRCGADRNREPCECEEPGDLRFAALADWKARKP